VVVDHLMETTTLHIVKGFRVRMFSPYREDLTQLVESIKGRNNIYMSRCWSIPPYELCRVPADRDRTAPFHSPCFNVIKLLDMNDCLRFNGWLFLLVQLLREEGMVRSYSAVITC
jgi:hypothetical protein